jgi:hypothetical protein
MGDISTEVSAEVKPAGFSGAEYNLVATKAELEGVNLLSTRFDVQPEALVNTSEMALSHGRKVISCGFDAERKHVVAIFQYNVQGKLKRKKVLDCTADYAVMYTTPEGAVETAAIGFCKNVGRFTAYPYFRALVAQLTWNAGMVLPPLPTIASTAHIPPKKKESQIVEG